MVIYIYIRTVIYLHMCMYKLAYMHMYILHMNTPLYPCASLNMHSPRDLPKECDISSPRGDSEGPVDRAFLVLVHSQPGAA